ncbi:patatin, partial [Haematococcus lacustris]
MTNSAARRGSGDFMPVIDDLQHLDGVVLREQEHCSPVLACHGVCNDQLYSCKPNDDLSVSDAPTTRLQDPDTGINPCFKAESHPEHPAVAAWKAGCLGLTFSGGGFLLSYHLGVLEALQGIGVIQPGLTPVAGASSGSLAAAAFHCHMTQPGGRAMACVEGGTRLRLGGLLRQQLMQELPDKAEEACSGRAAVAVTQALPVARRIMVTEFHSREDLLDALTASCWLPRYSGPSLTCTFRGRACMDGGTLDLLPPLPWSSMRLPGPPWQATDQSRLMVAEESMEAEVVKARGAIASTYTVK